MDKIIKGRIRILSKVVIIGDGLCVNDMHLELYLIVIKDKENQDMAVLELDDDVISCLITCILQFNILEIIQNNNP